MDGIGHHHRYLGGMRPGDTAFERFEIRAFAGSGGMGAVYRALDRQTNDEVALKVLHDVERGLERFEREARILAQLHHPGVVQYVAHGRGEDGKPWLAMEWLEGEDLAVRLRREALNLAESVDVARRVAEALGAAHRLGIVHRDLKPSNVFLVGARLDHVKILDFGIAQIDAARSVTRTGTLIGTPGYAAPEQARAEQDVDARADVFSLGCVLFECITGRAAFLGDHSIALLAKILLEDAPRVRELRFDVSDDLDALVGRMLAKDRAARPINGMAVAEELSAITELESPPRVEDDVSQSSNTLTPHERRLLTVVVVDRDAGRLAQLAREHRARFERLAHGSAIITLSGVGSAADLAARAGRCALAIRRADPEAKLAVATGRGRLQGRIPVGEAIDRAVAMLASGPWVPIDEVTAGLLPETFDVGGQTQGLVLRGESEFTEPTMSRRLAGKPTPFVGRDAEISMLEAVFDSCVSEPMARAVVVLGAPGGGKTRLCRELISTFRHRVGTLEVWNGKADAMRAGSPYTVLASALLGACQLAEDEPLPVRQLKLRARISRHLPAEAVNRVTEFLAEVIGMPFAEGSPQLVAARHDVTLLRDQVERAWLELLAAEALRSPLLLVLEDMHWGDLPSVKVVDAALRKLAALPFMVIVLARPEVREIFPGLFADRDVLEVSLGELSKRACERLLREVLPDLPPEIGAQLIERSTGNPFYLEELMRGQLEQRSGAPGTVLAMVQARLLAMEPDARQVLRAASIFGDVAYRGGVETLVGRERPIDIGQWLTVLADREVLTRRFQTRVPGETEYEFRHTIVREAAYSMLTDDDRVLGHRLAAEWLAAVGAGTANEIAEHFEQGGRRDLAAVHWARAAEEAVMADDLDGALARAQRSAQCGATGEVLGYVRLVEVDALIWAGRPEEAMNAGRDAMALLKPGSDAWCRAAGETAIANLRADRLMETDRIARELFILFERGDRSDALLGALARVGILTLDSSPDPVRLRKLAAVSLTEAKDITTRAWLHALRGEIAGDDLAKALSEYRNCAALFEQAGNLRLGVQALANVGQTQVWLGLRRDGEETLKSALRAAEKAKLPRARALSRYMLGIAARDDGRKAAAVELLTLAAEDYAGQQDRASEALVRSHLARTLLQIPDRIADAQREAVAAEGGSGGTAATHALAVLTHSSLVAGDTATAKDAADRAEVSLESIGAERHHECYVRLVLADAAARFGDPQRAARIRAEARATLDERAKAISSPELAQHFLTDVPEHRQLIGDR